MLWQAACSPEAVVVVTVISKSKIIKYAFSVNAFSFSKLSKKKNACAFIPAKKQSSRHHDIIFVRLGGIIFVRDILVNRAG